MVNDVTPSTMVEEPDAVFPPFLAGQLLAPDVAVRGIVPLCTFCLVSSAGYIFNDLLDREQDRRHPRKQLRPLAAGRVSIHAAVILAAALLGSALWWASISQPNMVPFLLGYLTITLCYSLWLKNIPVVDLFCISSGFLIRLQAGGTLFQIPISPWLFLTVLLLSMFLSTGKRFGELQALGDDAGRHRASLIGYPSGFLAGTLYLTAGTVLVTYAIYVVQHPKLIYSVPLCLFGLLRYILRVSAGKGGDPTEALLKDYMLLLVTLSWVVLVFWSIYR